MPNFITKAFSKFDIFGSEVGLNFQKDNVFKTTFGGFMSLGFVAFIENVTANVIKQFQDDPEQITLNKNNFMFAVKINQDDFLSNPMFNLTLEYRQYLTFPNGTKVRNKYAIQLEPCRIDHFESLPKFNSNWTLQFAKYAMNTYLCPRVTDEFILGGNYNSEYFYHWKFTVSKCSNNTPSTALWKPVCQSDQKITEYFKNNQNVRFLMLSNNYIINALKSQNYIEDYVEDTVFFSLQRNSTYQTADIFFTENRIDTDQSILPFQNVQQEKYLLFNQGNFRTQYVIGPTEKIIADFFIRKDPFVYITSRSFQKVSEIISYIGGFSQIFILLTAILVNYYNEYIYAISLANKIYDFQFGDTQKIDQQHKKQKNQKLELLKGNNDKALQFKQKMKDGSNVDNKQSTPLPIQIELGNNINQLEEQEQINKRNNKKKRVTTREDDGLLPLDKIRSIIQQRKSLIEQTQNQSHQKQNYLSVKSFEKKSSFEQIIEESQKQINQSAIIEKDEETNQGFSQLEIIRSKDQIDDKQKTNLNLQNDAVKIEFKDAMHESVNPETPLKIQKNLLQLRKEIMQNKQRSNEMNDELKININKNYDNRNIAQLQNDNESSYQNENNPQFQQPELLSQEQLNITSNQTLNKIKSPTYSGVDSPKQKFFSQNNILQGLGYKDQKQFLTKEFEYLLRRDSTIKMTYKFFIYKITCGRFCRTEQVLLLDRANKQMKKDLDIFMIVNRLKELEKMKVLFLDKNQEILFNFFPKPVISVHNNEENLSRAEIQEQFKNKNDSIGNISQKNIKVKEKHQKKLNINFKTAALVSKAASQFKKPILEKINRFDNVIAYQKLYSAYEQISANGVSSVFNKKLIEQLGSEMNKIFEISTLIANKGGMPGKHRDYQNIGSERNITIQTPQQINRNVSQFKQYDLHSPQEQQEQGDLTSKRNMFSEEMTQIQSTERKL